MSETGPSCWESYLHLNSVHSAICISCGFVVLGDCDKANRNWKRLGVSLSALGPGMATARTEEGRFLKALIAEDSIPPGNFKHVANMSNRKAYFWQSAGMSHDMDWVVLCVFINGSSGPS
jgi:hypothetical protein